jgi:hypothetical protein
MGVIVVCGRDGGSTGTTFVGFVPVGRGRAVVVWAAMVFRRGAAVHVGCVFVIAVHQEGGSRVRGVVVGGIVVKGDIGTVVVVEEGEIEVFAGDEAQLGVPGVGRVVRAVVGGRRRDGDVVVVVEGR